MGFSAGAGFYGLEVIIRGIKGAIDDTLGSFAQLQETMARVAAYTDINKDSIAAYTQQLIQMSTQGRISANQLGEGLYYIASSGIAASDSLTVLDAVTKAANAGLGNMTDLSRTVVSVLQAYNLQASSSGQITDMMAAAVRDGTLEVNELSQTLGRVIPIAATMGIGLDQVLASMVSMSQVGFTGAQAMTAVRGTILALEAPTRQTQKALEAMGMTAQQLTELIGDQGYGKALQIMYDRTGGNVELLRNLIPNIRALAGTLGEVNQPADKYNQVLDDIQHSTGSVDNALQIMSQTFNFQKDMFLNNLKAMGIGIGGFIGDAVTPLLQVANTAIPAAMEMARGSMTGVQEEFGFLGDAEKQAIDQVKAGDWNGAFQTIEQAAGQVLQQVLNDIGQFGESMFGAGFNLVESLAGGMMQAANSVLQSVIDFIANTIASFLIGFSPPRAGPLANIQTGGMNVMKAYMDGLQQGTSDLPNIVQNNIANPLDQYLGQAVSNSKGYITDLKGSIASIGTAADEISANIDGIKQHFQDAIDPIQRELDTLDRSFQNIQRDLDIANEKATAAQLGVDIAQAQGDPAARAEIEAHIQALQLDKEHYANLAQIAELASGHAKSGAGDRAKENDDQRQILQLKEQEYNMTDHAKLAELLKQQSITKEQIATNEAAKGLTAAQKEAAELPLKNQIQDIKQLQQDTIAPLQHQLDILKEQKKTLDDIKTAAGAAGGGAGGGIGKGIGSSIPPKPDFQAMFDSWKTDLAGRANALGQEAGKSIVTGMGDFLTAHLGGIIGAVIGAVAGASLLGPIGIPIGALLGGYIAQGVQNRLKEMNVDFGPFTEKAKTAFANLNTEVQPYLSDLSVAMQAWGVRNQTFWEQHGDQIKRIAGAQWQDIKDIIGGNLRVTADLVEVGADLISGNWSKAGEDIKRTGQDTWTYVEAVTRPELFILQATIGQAMSGIGGLVHAGLDDVKSVWDGAMTHIKDFAKERWDLIPPDIRADLVLISSTLRDRTQEQLSTWITSLGAMFSHAGTFWKDTTTLWSTNLGVINANAVSSFTQNLVDVQKWLDNLGLTIHNMIAPIAAEASKLGEAIIQGILDTLGRMGGQVSDKVGSIVRDALNAAKHALGIGSPSREFMFVGQAIIDGLVQGIDSLSLKPQQALERALPQGGTLPAYALGNTAATGMAAQHQQQLVININAPVYGVDNMQQVIVQALETAQLRGRTVPGLLSSQAA